MKKIWLIRHGQSKSNAGLRTANTIDNPLTDKGIEQAQCIVKAFDQIPSLIVTSPYLRSKQTAQPTLNHFVNVREEEWSVHEFTPLASIHYAGTPAIARRRRKTMYWEQGDPFYVDGEGAESFAAVLSRIQDFMERIKKQQETFTAVFTHGTFMRIMLWSILARVMEIDPPLMNNCYRFKRSFKVPNGAILQLSIDEKSNVLFSPIITDHLPAELAD